MELYKLQNLCYFVVGFIAMYATLASRDVDCCLIPESPFYLEGEGGLYEFVEKRLRENGHMVIVTAEGAGQELLAGKNEQDASGNKQLQDVGLWISQKIKVYMLAYIISLYNSVLPLFFFLIAEELFLIYQGFFCFCRITSRKRRSCL